MPAHARKALKFAGEIADDAFALVCRLLAAAFGSFMLFMLWVSLPVAFRDEMPESPSMAATALGPAALLEPVLQGSSCPRQPPQDEPDRRDFH